MINKISLRDFLISCRHLITDDTGKIKLKGSDVIVVFGERSRVKILTMTLGRLEPDRLEILHKSMIREDGSWGELTYTWKVTDAYKIQSVRKDDTKPLSTLASSSILIDVAY